LKFPHRLRARRTGTAPLVAAAVPAAATFMSGAAGAQIATGPGSNTNGFWNPSLGVPDLAALAADFGRD
jgi:hypothetical protein